MKKFVAFAAAVALVGSLSACGADSKLVPSVDGGTKVVKPVTPVVDSGPKLTVSQKNAIAKAKSYLRFEGFSKKGLIDQLEFEGFSASDSAFGAANAGANWTDEADQKAASYMSFESFSRSGLISQLEFEGFTAAQSSHGATSVGL